MLVYNYGQIKREHRDIICFQLADNDLLYITELASLLSLLHTTSSAFKSEANQFPGKFSNLPRYVYRQNVSLARRLVET